MKTVRMTTKLNYYYNRLKLLILLSFGFGLGMPAYAQYDVGFTHYMFNEFFINPAYTGAKEALSINGLGRLQWVDFDGAPQTYTLNGHAPLSNNHLGVGAGLLYERIGVGSHASGYANFAYRILFPKTTLSFGIQASAGGQSADFEKLKNMPEDIANDNLLANEAMGFIPNVGFGAMYYGKNFYAGFSIPRMLNNNYLKGENKRFNYVDWTYYFTGGYVFEVTDNFSIMPFGMLKLTQGVRPQLDIAVTSLLYKVVWLGLDYRTDNTLAPLVGIQLNQYLRFNYSYDVNLDAVKRANMGGSHEVSLMYTFDYLKKHIVSPRLF